MSTPKPPQNNRQGSQSGLAATARGRWVEIMSVLAPELEAAIDAHGSRTPHVACPNHGGQDGFRLFTGHGTGFNDTGGGICNTCGPSRDGIRLLSWVYAMRDHGQIPTGTDVLKEYPDALRKAYADIAYYLDHGVARNPDLRNRAPRIMAASTPEEIARQAEEDKKRREHLMSIGQKMWGNARAMDPLLTGYFSGRGTPDVILSDMQRINPQTPYYANGGTTYHPAMIMPVSRVDGGKLKVIGLHRIYLHEHEDGRVTKAPVDSPKKIMPWGDLEGAAIRLYKVTGNILAVGEGVETMTSVHAMTNLPAWSCVTAWGLETLQIPDDVDTILIAADYDVSGKGQSSAEKLAARVKEAGKTAIILSPSEFYNPSNPSHKKGVDWDDAYREDPARAKLMWEPYMDVEPPSIENT